MSIDCLLIYPYLEEANWKNELRSKDNLALGYLASCARNAGFSVQLLHAEHNKCSIKQIEEIVSSCNPKTVGISCTAQRAYPVVREYAKAIKRISNALIFVGGVFPTIAYKDILDDCKEIDVISLGEGEEFIVDFLQVVDSCYPLNKLRGIAYRDSNQNVLSDGIINIIEDLDKLPYPAKDFFADMEEELKSGFYYLNVSAGRGCYGNCSFCSLNEFTRLRKRRVRSPANVVSEIKFFQGKYNIKYIKFVDEIFIDKTNPQWIHDFVEEMQRQSVSVKFHIEARVECITDEIIGDLKKVGLDEVFVGLESGNQETLNRYRKGHSLSQAEEAVAILRKHGVKAQYGYIMIDPALRFSQLKDNIIWLLRLGGYSKHNLYNKLNLYYGTDLSRNINYATSPTVFYERKAQHYEDENVYYFANLIDYAKEQFSVYNVRVNQYFLHAIRAESTPNWKRFSQQLAQYEAHIWRNIVEEALTAVEAGRVEISEWIPFVENNLNAAKDFFENKVLMYRSK